MADRCLHDKADQRPSINTVRYIMSNSSHAPSAAPEAKPPTARIATAFYNFNSTSEDSRLNTPEKAR